MFCTTQKYQFSFPTRILFGAGTTKDVAASLKENGLKRPLIVTDKGLRNHKMVQSLSSDLVTNGFQTQIFSDFSGNPVESHVSLGKTAFHQHQADCIVAIGGGAALDVAKAIALMSRHDGSILDYAEGHSNKRAVTNQPPYLIAIPTTAGTGSEVGRSTVISDEVTHEKKVVFHPSLLAPLVILDPELTVDMPASITAATGMDALSHLLESYLAKDFHPICDAIALHGLALLGNHLVPSFRIAESNPTATRETLIARGNMMLAATMGAIAFQKGLGVTHSCAHALSSVCNTHHGLANGVMLPFAMAFNAKSVPEKFITLAQSLGLQTHSAHAVVEWIKGLQTELKIPNRLSEIGVKQSDLNNLVDFALKDGCHENNPTPVSRNDFMAIFESAL